MSASGVSRNSVIARCVSRQSTESGASLIRTDCCFGHAGAAADSGGAAPAWADNRIANSNCIVFIAVELRGALSANDIFLSDLQRHDAILLRDPTPERPHAPWSNRPLP